MRHTRRTGKLIPMVPAAGGDEPFWSLSEDLFLVLEMDGLVRRANPATLRFLGLSADALAGRSAFGFVHPDDAEQTAEHVGRVLAAGSSQASFQSRWRDASHTWRTLLWSVHLSAEDLMYAIGKDITERALAEARLADAENRYRVTIDGMEAGVLLQDADTRILLANQSAQRMFEMTEEELRTYTTYDAVWPSVREDGSPLRADEFAGPTALRTGETVRMIYGLDSPDGERLWLSAAAGPLFAPGADAPHGVVLALHDVTKLKEVERELREAEERFRGAFEHAPIGMTIVTLDHHLVQVNRAMCDLLGRSEEELVGSAIRDVMHPDDIPEAEALVARCLDGEVSWAQTEKRYVHADGSTVWALASISLVRDAHGAPSYFVSQVEDTSERRRAEIALRENQQLLEAIIDNSPAAISVKDRDGRYVLVSRCVEDVTGVPARELLGNTEEGMLDPELAALYRAHDLEVLESGEPRSFDERIVRPGGEAGTAMAVKFPLFDADGKPSGVCSISTDITDRVRAGEERRRLEDQLRQAERLDSVGKLAGGVAHDFNNLLSIIINYLAFMGDEVPAGSRMAEDMEEVRLAAEQAAELTRQLLLFGRRELDRPTVIDLNAVVAANAGLLDRTVGEAVRLDAVTTAGLWPVEAVRAELDRVLVNLVLNARDAIDGEGLVVVETANVEVPAEPALDRPALASGRYVRLAVRDSGSGMSPDVARRAFEPFFTTKPRGAGSGLGLATVWGIASRAGGTAQVEARPGPGTTVSILLPASEQPAGTAADAPPAVAPEQAGATGATILLVEDEPAVREMVRRILSEHGHEVLEASGGEEALHLTRVREGSFDLVLTDVVMPGLTGRDLVARLSASGDPVPAVFMSGYAHDVMGRAETDAEGTAFLAKPFDREALLSVVRAALAGGSRAGR